MNYRLLGALCVPFAASLAAAVGPTSTLYVMNYGQFGSSVGLDLFQGASFSSFPTGNNVDICIGVAGGDVRTMGYSGLDAGSRFNLTGAPLAGGPYTNTTTGSQLHDGTSDGSFNYSVDYTTGDVLRFDRNWGSRTTLFNATATLPGAGYITMNATDGTFWLSQWGGGDRVEHRTPGGALISSFNFGFAGAAGLALDPVDGTLWTSNGSTTLLQYTQAGATLQAQTYSLAGQFYGMEFETTPAPAPGVVAALSLFAARLLRRRR
jgi:MYXO-CTERM domain-containing protein